MITYDEFTALVGTDTGISEEDFPVLETQAVNVIGSITNYATEGASALSEFQQNILKNAVAAEVLYIHEQGGLSGLFAGTSGAGFTVGKVHIDGEKATGAWVNGLVSPAVYAILAPAGLLERRVACFDPFRLPS